MKSSDPSFKNKGNNNSATPPIKGAVPKESKPGKWGTHPPLPPGIRTTPREYANPVDYQHRFESMARFARLLALRCDSPGVGAVLHRCAGSVWRSEHD